MKKSKNLYDAVMSCLGYDEKQAIKEAKEEINIQFPKLDEQELALKIEAALHSTSDCIIVASNN